MLNVRFSEGVVLAISDFAAQNYTKYMHFLHRINEITDAVFDTSYIVVRSSECGQNYNKKYRNKFCENGKCYIFQVFGDNISRSE
jgi:rRNA maturation endonuclease Nob1